MFALGLATAAFVVFVAGVAHDSRSFSNAVFLGLALALGALGGAERLAGTHDRAAHLLLLALVLLAVAGPFFVALYLVGNGVTMVRNCSSRADDGRAGWGWIWKPVGMLSSSGVGAVWEEHH